MVSRTVLGTTVHDAHLEAFRFEIGSIIVGMLLWYGPQVLQAGHGTCKAFAEWSAHNKGANTSYEHVEKNLKTSDSDEYVVVDGNATGGPQASPETTN